MRIASLAAWTVALAVTAGCGDTKRDDGTAAGAAGTARPPAEAKADANDPSTMTVTGCLQRDGEQGDFVLARVNAPSRPVATTGTDESGAGLARQREAADSYRLSGGPDDLSDWIGHEVRITGKLEDHGGMQSPTANRQVKEGELAKLEVTSAESVAATCSTTATRPTERP